MTNGPGYVLRISGYVFVTSLLFASCSHDIHQTRAATVKDHVEAFYDHLTHDRVAAAVRENEAIEAMASQMGNTIKIGRAHV